MKKILLAFMNLILIIASHAQDTLYYAKDNSKVTDASLADYYVLLRMVPGKDQIVKRSFFTDHQMRSEEYFKFQDASRKQVITHGKSKMWYANGKLKSEIDYADGEISGLRETYWENGIKKRIDKYDAGTWIEGSCFDSSGLAVTYYPFKESPSFPGGINKMYEYLASNLRYPSGASRRGGKEKVYTSFLVNTEGTISDIKIEGESAKDVNKEAIKVIMKMPKWIPAKEDGEVVNERYTLPITFVVQ